MIVRPRKRADFSELSNPVHVITESPLHFRDDSAGWWEKLLFGKQQGALINIFRLARLFMQNWRINSACLGEDQGPVHGYFQIEFDNLSYFFFLLLEVGLVNTEKYWVCYICHLKHGGWTVFRRLPHHLDCFFSLKFKFLFMLYRFWTEDGELRFMQPSCGLFASRIYSLAR